MGDCLRGAPELQFRLPAIRTETIWDLRKMDIGRRACRGG